MRLTMHLFNKLGYCCINQTLRNKNVYTGRKLIRKNFSLDSASILGLQNVKDLLKIIQWNEENNIKVFRIGSEILPRQNDPECGYKIDDLKDSQEIRHILSLSGKLAEKYNQKLSFHPGAFVCLGSPSDDVAKLSITTLDCENQIADALSKDTELDIVINFHVGGSYGEDFAGTAERFIRRFKSLDSSLKQRICLENDDKGKCWSVKKLYDYITQHIHIPICFDFHHYLFCNDESDLIYLRESFELAYNTWGTRNMQIHYSESANPNKLIPAHSDYYKNPLPSWLNEYNNFHIHLEAKQKELALFKYRNDFCKD